MIERVGPLGYLISGSQSPLEVENPNIIILWTNIFIYNIQVGQLLNGQDGLQESQNTMIANHHVYELVVIHVAPGF